MPATLSTPSKSRAEHYCPGGRLRGAPPRNAPGGARQASAPYRGPMVLPVGLRDMGPERGAWAQQGEAVPEERTGHPPLRGQRPAEASDALESPGGPG
jgi:hypothetical protein